VSGLVSSERGRDGIFRIVLNGPRANALEPGLLTELLRALDDLAASGARRAILSGGRNFSTGGDVARFLDAAERGEAEDYADRVVPLLQDCVARIVAMPALVAVAARGAITGGAAGLLFASDIAVLSPDAFVQPYYATVGFAADGGWTALLPGRIGLGAAQDWLHADRRKTAEELSALRLASEVHPEPEERAAGLLSALNIDSALAAKRLLWDDPRQRALHARLDAETAAFRALIGQPATRAGMARFLGKTADAARV
jgi:2-(1,2-epoxy-1,2-dihydrophenyl)acetyl-CoA isomerase